MFLDDLKKENKLHKSFFDNNLKRFECNKLLKEQYIASHEYRFYEENKVLKIRNNIDNRKDCITISKPIFCITDLLEIREDTIGYITNLSLLEKHKYILDRVYLDKETVLDLRRVLTRFVNLDLIEFKRVLDLQSFITKSVLLGGKIVKNTDIFTCVLIQRKLFVVSEFQFLLDNNSNLVFYDINCDLLHISNFDLTFINSLKDMFADCYAKNIRLVNFDTKNIKKFSRMFAGCTRLESVNVENFDMSNALDCSFMFSDCVNVRKLDIENWCLLSVCNLSYMFYNCSSLSELNIQKWSTPKLENMSYFICGCESLREIDFRKMNESLGLNIFGLKTAFFDKNTNKLLVRKGGFVI